MILSTALSGVICSLLLGSLYVVQDIMMNSISSVVFALAQCPVVKLSHLPNGV